jgi:hypothetical protein
MRMRGKSRSQLTVRYTCKAYSGIDHVNVLVNVNVPGIKIQRFRVRLRAEVHNQNIGRFCLASLGGEIPNGVRGQAFF